MMMEATILLLTLFHCPPIPCAEITQEGNVVLLCLEGEAYPPTTLPADKCETLPLESLEG